jgi:hypothetical protein
MAKAKQIRIDQLTGHTLNRLQIIDSLLVTWGHIPSRRIFINRVGNKLGKEISDRTFDSDIEKIRQILFLKGDKVRLVWGGGGYRYTDRDFSLFGCLVRESDSDILKLGLPLYRRYFGEQTARLFLDFCTRVMGMVCSGEADSFKGIPVDTLISEKTFSEKETYWTPRILRAILEKSTVCAVFKGNGGTTFHLSPYRLVEGMYGFELEAHRFDPTGQTEDVIGRFALADLKEVSASNKTYMAEERFLSDREGMAKVHRLKNRSEEQGYEGMDDHGIRA